MNKKVTRKKIAYIIFASMLIAGFGTSMCVKRSLSESEEEGERDNAGQDNNNGALYNDSFSDDSSPVVQVARRGSSRHDRYRAADDLAVEFLRNQVLERLSACAEGFGFSGVVLIGRPVQRPPLIEAIQENRYDRVITLLERGDDPNHVNNGSVITPLRAAFKFHASLEIIEALISQGATLNGKPYRKGSKGDSSVIMAAADEGCTWYIKHLLEFNADPGSTDPETGESLLHKLAKQEGALWLVKELVLVYGRAQDVHKKDKYGKTPIEYAKKDIKSFLETVRAGLVYRNI